MQTKLADQVASSSYELTLSQADTDSADSALPNDWLTSSGTPSHSSSDSDQDPTWCSSFSAFLGRRIIGKLAEEIKREEAWLLTIIVGVNFLSFCAGSMLAPVLPGHLTEKIAQFDEDRTVSETEISIAFVLYAGSAMVFSLVFGPLIPRVGITTFYYPGLAVIGISNIALGSLDYLPITSYRTYIYCQCAVRVIEGIGSAAFNTSSHSIIMKVFSKNIDEAFAVVEAAVAISFSLGPVIGSFLVNVFGWFWAFFVFGTFVLFCLPLSSMVFNNYGSLKHFNIMGVQDAWLPLKIACTWKGFFVMLTLLVSATAYSFVEPTLELFLEEIVQTEYSILYYFAQAAAFAVSALGLAPFIAKRSKLATMTTGSFILGTGFLAVGPCKYIFQNPNDHMTMIGVILIGFGFALCYVPTLDAFVDTAVNDLGYHKDATTFGPISGLWNFLNGFGETFGPGLAMLQTSPDFRDATVMVAASVFALFIIQIMVMGIITTDKRPTAAEEKLLLLKEERTRFKSVSFYV